MQSPGAKILCQRINKKASNNFISKTHKSTSCSSFAISKVINKTTAKALSIATLFLLLSSLTFPISPVFADTNDTTSSSSTNSTNVTTSSSITTTGGNKVSVSLSDIITMRILDASGSTEIENLTLDLMPTPLGVFSSGSILAEVSTSNSSGYKLYLSTDHQDHSGNYTNSLVNIDENIGILDTGKILSLTTDVTQAAFSESESSYRNRWGYSINALSIARSIDNNVVTNTMEDNVNSNSIIYHQMPEHSETTSIRSDTLSPVEQELTPVTIGVNASSGVAAGTYKNVLEFTAIANPPILDYSLTFNANTDDTVTNMPETNPMTTESMAGQVEFVVPETVPNRNGYVFLGWSTKPTYTAGETVEGNTGSGTDGLFVSGDKYTIIADDGDKTSRTRALYAVWKVANFFTITYMQDMTPSICQSATTPAATALDSSRTDTDGSHAGDTSYVPETTLIDYRGTDGTGTAASPATGSNMRSYTVRKLADGNCWMSENLKLTLSTSHAYEVANFDGTTTSWTPNEDMSGEVGAYNAAITINTKTDISVNDKIEWYYPWYAATAGQGAQIKNPTISQSICPKGWRLPDNSNSPSFANIKTVYDANSTKLRSFPLSFYYAGDYFRGSLDNTDSGYYWSASPNTNNEAFAHSLLIYSSGIIPQNTNNKAAGSSIRCVSIP